MAQRRSRRNPTRRAGGIPRPTRRSWCRSPSLARVSARCRHASFDGWTMQIVRAMTPPGLRRPNAVPARGKCPSGRSCAAVWVDWSISLRPRVGNTGKHLSRRPAANRYGARCSTTKRTSSATDPTPSLSKMWLRCSSTVRWLISRATAIGLARLSGHDQVHHLPFPGRQRRQFRREGARGARRRARGRVPGQRLVDAVEQLLLAIGLGDEVHRAGLDRPDRDIDVGVRADEHDRDPGVHRVESILQRRPAHVRHADVEDQAAGRLRVEGVEELLRRRERRVAQADRIDELGDRIAHSGVIVDDEHGGLGHRSGSFFRDRQRELEHRSAARAGNVPQAAAVASTMVRQIDRPMPSPVSFVVWNGSNTRSASASGIPGPRSATRIRMRSSPDASASRRNTRSRAGTAVIASMALCARFMTTCWIWISSPSPGGRSGGMRAFDADVLQPAFDFDELQRVPQQDRQVDPGLLRLAALDHRAQAVEHLARQRRLASRSSPAARPACRDRRDRRPPGAAAPPGRSSRSPSGVA